MLKILVVEDEEQIRRILAEFLTKKGFEVVKAIGGEEAIRLLRSGLDMDLMITDMKMPKVTGMDVLKEKKNLKNTVPVIILTGSIGTERRLPELEEFGIGLDDVVVKPIDLFQLLDLVRKKLCIT